jgi:hypothetical protein
MLACSRNTILHEILDKSLQGKTISKIDASHIINSSSQENNMIAYIARNIRNKTKAGSITYSR